MSHKIRHTIEKSAQKSEKSLYKSQKMVYRHTFCKLEVHLQLSKNRKDVKYKKVKNKNTFNVIFRPVWYDENFIAL